jgi:ATP-binding cassette subfamily B protein
MPAGIMQVVGETGWRLSHGERNRLFVARALLQQPQLLVIDESFAALDPDNLQRCMRAATEGRHALLMVAHP